MHQMMNVMDQEVKESKTNADDFNPTSLDEHWNSQYMRDIRKKLMDEDVFHNVMFAMMIS